MLVLVCVHLITLICGCPYYCGTDSLTLLRPCPLGKVFCAQCSSCLCNADLPCTAAAGWQIGYGCLHKNNGMYFADDDNLVFAAL